MILYGCKCLKLGRQDKLEQLGKHHTSKPVMVSCEFNSHWRQLYFLLKLLRHINVNFVQKCQKCQICVIYENLDSQQKAPNVFQDSFRPLHKNVMRRETITTIDWWFKR